MYNTGYNYLKSEKCTDSLTDIFAKYCCLVHVLLYEGLCYCKAQTVLFVNASYVCICSTVHKSETRCIILKVNCNLTCIYYGNCISVTVEKELRSCFVLFF